ncbi:putative fatty acid synthase [Mycobacterium xenopi 4042]|uniref:Putative fatty acid synthase n=1 Tax=Mycobacterium xenopi 4042 TaxID=1299334 RepID=X8E5F1_MYCXE|nr:putative fatty acid synthase [Mycobacterium xenopi 4042]
MEAAGRRKALGAKGRQSGAPIDGVVVSAGIPELEEAVELIDELGGIGISHVVFKPGTVEQIRAVIRIATEVPTTPVIMHIEGGRAGGHHSWEDLDDLLLATYSELRSRPNITVCVGGGIGTPERAAEYLSGRWAEPYGFPLMPIDGILVGTAAMATKESTTSPSVKRMLVETQGTDQWISAGKAQGGMASSRSQLGADIHEIDNAASRCGRLLDEVAGDAEAVAKRRDEIIAAMAGTAKPYFGDVGEMTYAQWLRRYVELTIGDGTSTADTASPEARGWPTPGATASSRCCTGPRRGCTPRPRPHRDPVCRQGIAGAARRRDRGSAGALSRRRNRATAPSGRVVLRHVVQDAGQAGQLRAGYRQGRATLVAQRFTVAGPRRALRRRPGVHYPRPDIGRRHHADGRTRRRTARPFRAGRHRPGAGSRCRTQAGYRAAGRPHRRHRPAGRRPRRPGRAVGRSRRDQPGAPHRPSCRLADSRRGRKSAGDTLVHRARLAVDGEQVVLSVPISSTWVDIRFTLPPNTIDGACRSCRSTTPPPPCVACWPSPPAPTPRKPYRRCMTGPPPSRWVGPGTRRRPYRGHRHLR